jgi:uncharacterized membrane protein
MPELPQFLLAGAVTVWAVIFGTLVVWRHNRFGTFDHDLGIWDQAAWLLARGESFITVRGLNVFGFHASPALYLFAPLYWLGAGSNVLNLAMVGSVGLGAVVMFRIGRHHLADDWFALVLAVAFLVNYAAQWMMWETFHPEVIAIAPLLLAYLAAVQGRWRAYAVWLVLAVAWKEDVALAALMLGVVLAVRGRRVVGQWAATRNRQPLPPGPAGTRLAGLITIAAAIAWFLIATRLLIPAFSSGGNFTEALFGDLGSTPGDMARTALTQPEIVGEHFALSKPEEYVGQLTASFGFASWLSPLALLPGLPQLLINTLAIYDFFWTTRVHYAAMPLFATAVAAVEGVARVFRPGLRRALIGAVAVGAFFTAVSWGISPASPSFKEGFWPLNPVAEREAQLREAISGPGPDDAVSAVYNLVPHLSHRSAIYTFPNPWVPSNWGVAGENRPDPGTVDWLIIDPSSLEDQERRTLLSILDDPDRPVDPAATEPVSTEPLTPEKLTAAVDDARWKLAVNDPDLLVAQRVR